MPPFNHFCVEPHPGQRKGSVTHRAQATARQKGYRQSHPVLCGRVRLFSEEFYSYALTEYFILVAVFSLVSQKFISEDC